MKVLVLGASGYIGSSVAGSLVRAGHQVIGQTRDAGKWGKLFERNELEVLECDPVSDDKWLKDLQSIDVVVDCLGGASLSELSIKFIKKAENAERDATAAKLAYVWTSGVWLHGDNRFEFVTDGSEATHPPKKVAWRPEVENYLVASKLVDGVVIRPGLVYGRQSNVVGILFSQIAASGKIEWPGIPGGRYATVHVDDLDELYRLAVEKYPLVKGLKIEGSNTTTESVDTLLSHLVALTGVPSYSYKEPKSNFEVALAATSIVRGTFARSILGWHPSKPSLIDGLPIYYKAFLAGYIE